jgi:hypothetical protein
MPWRRYLNAGRFKDRAGIISAGSMHPVMTRTWHRGAESPPFCNICGRTHCDGDGDGGSIPDHSPDMDSIEIGGFPEYTCNICGKGFALYIEEFERINYDVHGAIVPHFCIPGSDRTIIDEPGENHDDLHFHASCLKGKGIVFGKPSDVACFHCKQPIVFSPEDPGKPVADREIVAFLPCMGDFDGGLERAWPADAGFGVYLHPACYGSWKKQFEKK